MDDLFHLHRDTVFLRREAIAAGYADRDLRALRAGSIVRPRYGGYVSREAWEAADARERYLMVCAVVMLQHGDRVMLSHTSAAVAAGLSVLDPDYSTVHVTRLDGRTGRIEAGVQHHVPAWGPSQVERRGEFLVADELTATLGAATQFGVEGGLVVADSFLSRNPDAVGRLWDGYRAVAGNPFARRLQLVVRLARAGGTTVFETRCRYAMWRSHLPEPELQWEVWIDGELVAIVDFAWPEHRLLGEADGRWKYGRLLGPNPTPEQVSAAMVSEKLREDMLREATGYGMIRYDYGELYVPGKIGARTQRMLQIHAPRAS
ncbi:hypothetical protein [Nocardioides marmoraquaticus]